MLKEMFKLIVKQTISLLLFQLILNQNDAGLLFKSFSDLAVGIISGCVVVVVIIASVTAVLVVYV